MKKLLEWFTKEKITTISFVLSIVFIVFRFIMPYYFFDFCQKTNIYNICNKAFDLFLIFTMISVPILVFSLIVLKLKESVFIFWRRFTNIYIYIL